MLSEGSSVETYKNCVYPDITQAHCYTTDEEALNKLGFLARDSDIGANLEI